MTVVCYCANWHCGASSRYAKELVDDLRVPASRVVEFAGGVQEWVLHAASAELRGERDHGYNVIDTKGALVPTETSLEHVLEHMRSRYNRE